MVADRSGVTRWSVAGAAALLVGYWLMEAMGEGPPGPFTPWQSGQAGAERQEGEPVPPASDDIGNVNARYKDMELSELADPGPLPAALSGAEPDVGLEVDDQGHLVPTYDVLVLFDFYLAGLADEPLETVLTRIHFSLSEQLEGIALKQARDLLRRYVDYRVALVDLDAPATSGLPRNAFSVVALNRRLKGLMGLRESMFTESENTAFFGLDQVQDEYAVRRLAIEQDPSLDEVQRHRAIAELESQLPADVRALRQRVSRDAELYVTTESMREQGASAEAVYQFRAEALGDEAAANLARLDRERAQWHQRLEAYARERDRIRQSGLSPADQRTAVERLLERSFSGLERKRVWALDPEL